MNENIGENTLNENDQELSGEGEVKIREPKPVEDNHIEQEGADSLSRLWNFAVSGKSIEKTPIADMEMAIKYIHDLDATVTKAAIRKGNYDLLMI